jgi:hypothetical protein|tara:strand:- start:229 stop:459 length:231 start_codon:yes stop_codon:yes gene_type:complete
MKNRNKDVEWTRTIQFSDKQQSVVSDIVLFINDLGIPDHIDQTTFNEVLEIVCDDSPFEWTVSKLDSLSEGKDNDH